MTTRSVHPEIKIKGLTQLEVDQLTKLAKEKGYDSRNDFLIARLRQLLKQDETATAEFQLIEYLKELVGTNHTLINKAEEIVALKQRLLTEVKNLQDSYAQYLEEQEGTDVEDETIER